MTNSEITSMLIVLLRAMSDYTEDKSLQKALRSAASQLRKYEAKATKQARSECGKE
jgi:hypothetical protein